MIAIPMPLRSKQALVNPLMSAEYPTGCYMIQGELVGIAEYF